MDLEWHGEELTVAHFRERLLNFGMTGKSRFLVSSRVS